MSLFNQQFIDLCLSFLTWKAKKNTIYKYHILEFYRKTFKIFYEDYELSLAAEGEETTFFTWIWKTCVYFVGVAQK